MSGINRKNLYFYLKNNYNFIRFYSKLYYKVLYDSAFNSHVYFDNFDNIFVPSLYDFNNSVLVDTFYSRDNKVARLFSFMKYVNFLKDVSCIDFCNDDKYKDITKKNFIKMVRNKRNIGNYNVENIVDSYIFSLDDQLLWYDFIKWKESMSKSVKEINLLDLIKPKKSILYDFLLDRGYIKYDNGNMIILNNEMYSKYDTLYKIFSNIDNNSLLNKKADRDYLIKRVYEDGKYKYVLLDTNINVINYDMTDIFYYYYSLKRLLHYLSLDFEDRSYIYDSAYNLPDVVVDVYYTLLSGDWYKNVSSFLYDIRSFLFDFDINEFEGNFDRDPYEIINSYDDLVMKLYPEIKKILILLESNKYIRSYKDFLYFDLNFSGSRGFSIIVSFYVNISDEIYRDFIKEILNDIDKYNIKYLDKGVLKRKGLQLTRFPYSINHKSGLVMTPLYRFDWFDLHDYMLNNDYIYDILMDGKKYIFNNVFNYLDKLILINNLTNDNDKLYNVNYYKYMDNDVKYKVYITNYKYGDTFRILYKDGVKEFKIGKVYDVDFRTAFVISVNNYGYILDSKFTNFKLYENSFLNYLIISNNSNSDMYYNTTIDYNTDYLLMNIHFDLHIDYDHFLNEFYDFIFNKLNLNQDIYNIIKYNYDMIEHNINVGNYKNAEDIFKYILLILIEYYYISDKNKLSFIISNLLYIMSKYYIITHYIY